MILRPQTRSKSRWSSCGNCCALPYNNATLLTYHSVSIGGVSKALLDTVTDLSGRSLSFVWQDLNAADPTRPAYRIVRVDGPQYAVAYSYNADFNLSACTLDTGFPTFPT
jgi:hypothetical protein